MYTFVTDMEKTQNTETAEVLRHQAGNIHRSPLEHLAVGVEAFAATFKSVWHPTWIPALATALVLALTFGGRVGAVTVSPVYYAPFHDINLLHLSVYVGGSFVAFLTAMQFKWNVFALLGTGKFEMKVSWRDRLFGALRCVQLAMLQCLFFGVPLALTLWPVLKVSVWLALLTGALALYLLPVAFLTTSAYLWADWNFRRSLVFGLITTARYWGRVFVALFFVYTAALVVCAIFLMPGFILKMLVYDNQTALAMGEPNTVSGLVAVLEYVCLAVGTFLSLFVLSAARFSCRSIYLQVQALLDARREERADRDRFMAEQRRLQTLQHKKGLRG